ncbi:MAG: TIR domain-containing protein [Anaerolineales bacterium]|nr:TIR domain-containing protein [Anaerolineales bacterium]
MTTNNDNQFVYDVVVSFAGEDRAIVQKFVRLLDAKKITYFYDEDQAHDLWGKDLTTDLADVYEKQARYCLMFISEYYLRKKWTNFERLHIQARAFSDPNEYILPIRLDDTVIPGIPETIGFRDLRQHDIENIVNTLERKLEKAKGKSTESTLSQDVQSATQESAYASFGSIPMPKRKKTFTQLEKDRFARESFQYIKKYFKQGLQQLERDNTDIQTDIEDMTSLQFISKIYVRGDIKAQCSIWLGDNFGPNSICYNEGVNRLGTSSINESIGVEDNGEELRLHVGFFGMHEERMATQQQAAEHLWKRFIAHLEHR